MTTEDTANKSSTTFPIDYDQGLDEPKVGKLAFDTIVDPEFEKVYKKYEKELGKVLAPVQYFSYDYEELISSHEILDQVNINYGVWQPFEQGLITQNRRGQVSILIEQFWKYFNNPKNKALNNMQGYPVDLPKIISDHKILEFNGGDLILNIETQKVCRISGEIGRYFYANGGYKKFGFPLGDEIWDKGKFGWSQKFEKGTIEYSCQGREDNWTFRTIENI